MSESRIAIIIDANGGIAVGEFNAVTGSVERLDKATDELNKRVSQSGREAAAAERQWSGYGKTIGIAIAAGFGVATTALGVYLRNSIEAERVQSQVASRIADTNGVALRSLQQLNAEAKRLQGDNSVFDSQSLGEAQAVLLTFRHIQGINFDRTIESSLDLATVMRTDVSNAAKVLGKALADPERGVRALTDAGVTFTKGERERIKAMMKAGEVTAAQQLILKKVDDAMGSAAETARDTLGGAFKALQREANDLLEGDDGSGGLKGTRDAVEELITTLQDPELKSGVDSVVEGMLRIANGAINVISWIGNAGSAIAEFFADNDKKSLVSLRNREVALETQLYGEQRAGRTAYGAFSQGLARLTGIGIDPADTQAELDAVRAEITRRNRAAIDSGVAAPLPVAQGEPFVPGGTEKPKVNRGPENAMRRLRELVRDQENETQSAVHGANNDHAKTLETIAALEKESAATTDLAERSRLLTAARDAAGKAHEKNLRIAQANDEAMARELDIVGTIMESYREEAQLLGLSAREREIEIAVIEASIKAREQYKKYQRDNAELGEQEVASIRATVGAHIDHREAIEASTAASEDYRRNWQGALSSVAGAFGDLFASGFQDTKDFTEDLEHIFKRWWSNLIAMFTDGALNRAFAGIAKSVSGWLSQMGNGGGGGGGGGIWSSLISAFTGGGGGGGGGTGGGGIWSSLLSTVTGTGGGGGSGVFSTALSAFTSGFSGAGAAGGGFWSSMMSGFSGAVSAFTGSLGAATTATGAYGSMLSGLTASWGVGGSGVGAAGSFAAGGGVATAGVGAAAVSWVPIVGWIVAGIMASSAAFKVGWDMQGQKTDISKWMMSKGNIGGAIDNAGVALADNFLKALGFSDSWAAAFSGSGLQTKMFGHKKPQVQGQGIQGSIGFAGFDGQSYADIKAKGGWFRSDKKWTETGAMDSTLDRAFDNASLAISMRAHDLAEQMGIDISSALSSVSIDIGKIEFDKDPEKARAQISEKIAEVMEGLSAEAVRALGFVRLLDDGFAAQEIMGALSASIALVTGSATNLGQALSALDVENVARAVEYFESLAIKNGTGLGDEIGRVVGLLGEYSSLITGVESDLQTRGLNEYQSAQLQIELQYRSQVRSANELARALGLSGARAEDLAKIEQLRAVNMAELQTAMEAQQNRFLDDLGLSDLSPLRDDQKLTESMQLLRDAVASGDVQRAQQLSQTALGLGRNLFASGKDYSGLYGEVTGLLGGMTAGGLDGFTETGLDNIADLLTGLPDGIAGALFRMLFEQATPAPPVVVTPPPVTTPGSGGGGGGRGGLGGGGSDTNTMLRAIVDRLDAVAANTSGSRDVLRSNEKTEYNVV